MLDLRSLRPLSRPPVGSLSIDLELVCYDRPLCLLLRSALGHLYIAHYLDVVGPEQESWLISAVSSESVEPLLTGGMGLADALWLGPDESRFLGTVQFSDEGTLEVSRPYVCPEPDALAAYLPNEDFRLFPDEFSGYLSREFAPIAEVSRNRGREVIYLRLLESGLWPWRLPLARLADVGHSFQRLVTHLALCAVDPGALGRRGTVRMSAELGSQYALTGLGPGSVRLRLEALSPGDDHPILLPEYDYAYRGARAFFSLAGLETGDSVCQELSGLHPRIRGNYLDFLAQLKRGGLGIQMEWASPRESTPANVTWQHDFVSEVADRIGSLQVSTEQEYEITGYFESGSMRNRKFRLVDVSTNRGILGRLEDDVEQDVITLSATGRAALYTVAVREVVFTTDADTTRYEYTFLDLQPL